MAEEKKVIKTDVLIVGAGPAGAGAGLFLGEYGKSRDSARKYTDWHQESMLS